MYIFKELESFSVVALNDWNNQRQTLLQSSLVLLLNQVTSLEQRGRSGVLCSENFRRCVFIRVSPVTIQNLVFEVSGRESASLTVQNKN
jgi:hypothetical protein